MPVGNSMPIFLETIHPARYIIDVSTAMRTAKNHAKIIPAVTAADNTVQARRHFPMEEQKAGER